MEWYSPNNEFKFIINRYENSFYNINSNYNYTIEFEIYNNLNILLLQLKLSEFDILKLFYELDQFINFINKNNVCIQLYSNNLRFEYYYFYFEKLYNMILFKLNQYSPFQNKFMNIIQFNLSNELFENFIYDILLNNIIDIDINIPDNLYNMKEKLNIIKNIYYSNSS